VYYVYVAIALLVKPGPEDLKRLTLSRPFAQMPRTIGSVDH
jgi:hypothetical protein